MNTTAYLSSQGEYTFFTFGDRTISFLTSKNLDRYTAIKSWVKGYLVVSSKNIGKAEKEDYIDLIPILQNLHIQPHRFLDGVMEVKIQYD